MSQIIKSEGTVQDFSHSDTNDKFEGIPKTTFIFNNLLDRVTDLTESFHTRGCGLLQGKDANWNQPRQEAHRAECRRAPNMALPAIRLLWGCYLLWPCCATVCTGDCHPGKLAHACGVRVFTGAQLQAAYMSGLSSLASPGTSSSYL